MTHMMGERCLLGPCECCMGGTMAHVVDSMLGPALPPVMVGG